LCAGNWRTKERKNRNPGPCKECDQHEDSALVFSSFFALVVLVAAFANEFGNMPQVKEITNGQPEDVVAFIERMVERNHWGGEEPYDKERAEQVRKAVDKARCDSLDSEEQALKRKYKGNKKVLDAIGKAKELVT
jgi:hypothetical protein